ncbi:MAG TPA: ImmA/IrrE family metallo-endopeptidase [Terriglobia bacterium]|nr:ImmA/IrrE family metallo-endopeptidase [Terriglobia bacterium]
MTSALPALITPRLVRWARERVRASHQAIADRLKVEPQQVASWEQGDLYPTFRQAHELANFLSIPFGYLYLSSPPSERTPLPDLRTLAGRSPKKLSPEFRDTLNEAILKQHWYRDYLQEQGRSRLEFIGKCSMGDDVNQVADDIRQTIGIDDNLRNETSTWEEFLTALVRRCDAKGILVFRNGVVGSNVHRSLSVREFRGFAITDDLAPVIFINTQDSKTAQIFTLVHETVHLWVGKSGISNPDLRTKTSEASNRIERFCNRIAAEILIPERGFLENWSGTLSIEQNLSQLSRIYRVSTSVALRRAYELNVLEYSEFLRLLKREEARWKRISRRKQDGGNFYNMLISRNSSILTRALVEGASEGRVLSREAARLLGVKISVIGSIAEKFAGAP